MKAEDIFIIWWFKTLAQTRSGSMLLSILLIIIIVIIIIIKIKHYTSLFSIKNDLKDIKELLEDSPLSRNDNKKED